MRRMPDFAQMLGARPRRRYLLLGRGRASPFLLVLVIALMVGLPEASAASKVVETQDFKFVQPNVSVTVGDTIVFRNTGEAPHNAQADDGSFKIAIINPGAEEKVVLSKAGTISYVCTFHKSQGMTGTIVVEQAAGAPPAAQPPAAQPPAAQPPAAIAKTSPAPPAASATPKPAAQAPPSERYFPKLAVGLLVLLIGGLGLGYFRFILKTAQKQT